MFRTVFGAQADAGYEVRRLSSIGEPLLVESRLLLARSLYLTASRFSRSVVVDVRCFPRNLRRGDGESCADKVKASGVTGVVCEDDFGTY